MAETPTAAGDNRPTDRANSRRRRILGAFLGTAAVAVALVFWWRYAHDPVRVARRGVMGVSSFDAKGRERAGGAGFCVSPGVVVTSRHLIVGAARVAITAPGGKRCRPDRVLAEDRQTDLILLHVPLTKREAKPLRLSRRGLLHFQPVIIVEYPRTGVRSVRTRRIGYVSDFIGFGTAATIDHAVPPSLTGAPVTDETGEVRGILVSRRLDSAALRIVVHAQTIQRVKQRMQPVSIREYLSANRVEWDGSVQAACDRGALFYVGDRYKQSLIAYRNALAKDAKRYDALCRAASCCSELNRQSEARALAIRAISMRPNARRGYCVLGGSYYDTGDFAEAIAPLRKASRLGKRDGYELFCLGASYAALGRYPEAVAAYKLALRIRPGDSLMLTELGYTYLRWRKKDRALETFMAACRANPYDAEARIRLGDAYMEMNKGTLAKGAYRKAMRVDPEDPRPHIRLAGALRSTGLYLTAMQEVRKALRLDPSEAEAYIEMARVYDSLHKEDEAVESLSTAARLDPKDAYVAVATAYAHSKAGRYPKAIAAAERAVELRKDYSDTYCHMGIAYARSGDTESARKQLAILERLDKVLARALEREIRYHERKADKQSATRDD